MAYQQVDGLYQVPLVDFGRALEKQGWRVREHSAFGGVTPNVHSPKGHHPHDEALDITWWKSETDPSGSMGWKAWTQNLGERLGQLKGAGGQYLQALHPGNEPKGHGTHAHLGVTGGVLALTPQQMQSFGLQNVSPATTETTTTEKPEKVEAPAVTPTKDTSLGQAFLTSYLKERNPVQTAFAPKSMLNIPGLLMSATSAPELMT